MKSLDLYEIYQFDSIFFVVSRFVTKLQMFEKVRAINTFETASTKVKPYKLYIRHISLPKKCVNALGTAALLPRKHRYYFSQQKIEIWVCTKHRIVNKTI